MPSLAKVVLREQRERGKRGVFLDGGEAWGGGEEVSWRASWFAGFVVTTPVTKAEGGRRGLSKVGAVWIGCV